MRRSLGILVVLVLLAPLHAADWPQFRGVDADGIGRGKAAPVAWEVASGKNVKWKSAIPGLGFSSPVVHGDHIYLTTAISGMDDPELKVGLYGQIKPVDDETVHKFLVLAIDRKSGKIAWQHVAHEGVPQIKRHTKASHANSTIATDGKVVVAMFGSEGLYGYDTKGKQLWKVDLGLLDSGFFMAPQAQWGYAGSPIIEDGLVIVQADVQKDSFIAAFDVKTGKEKWRTPREEVPTWSTPAIVEVDGKKQIVVNGWKHIGGYDLKTGKEIWKMSGLGDIPVPTPIVGHGHVYITNAHGPGSPVYAVKLGAKGDISLGEGETSNEHITWSIPRGGAYMQTPILIDDVLYVCRDNGVLSAFDARSGERLYQERLGDGASGYTASAVASGGHIYYTSELGDVHVLKAGRELNVLGTHELDEIVMATPAVADGVIYFRGKDHLFAIGE